MFEHNKRDPFFWLCLAAQILCYTPAKGGKTNSTHSPSAPANRIFYGVQALLLQDGPNGLQVYLQQRHETMRSFPRLWVPVGGNIDELRGFSPGERYQLGTVLTPWLLARLRQPLGRFSTQVTRAFYADKAVTLFDQRRGRAYSASPAQIEAMVSELLSQLDAEVLRLANGNLSPADRRLWPTPETVLRLIELITAKRELEEEAGIDMSGLPATTSPVLRHARSTSQRRDADGSTVVREYAFNVFLFDANDQAPRHDHDTLLRRQLNWAPRLESRADGWFFPIKDALQMAQANAEIAPQTLRTLSLLGQWGVMTVSDALKKAAGADWVLRSIGGLRYQ